MLKSRKHEFHSFEFLIATLATSLLANIKKKLLFFYYIWYIISIVIEHNHSNSLSILVNLDYKCI